jgi:hypothetical protein
LYEGAKKSKCPKLLLDSLRAALNVTAEDLSAHGGCARDPTSARWDLNRWTVASAISVPPFPFQNRPTFQQTVELTKRLPR